METQSDVLALFMQSVSLALAGFAGVAAWVYASKRADLVSEAVSPQEANELKISILAEPLDAVFTITFAFIGTGIWNLCCLRSLVFGIVFKVINKINI